MKYTLSLLLGTWFLLTASTVARAQTTHPFLLINPSDIASYQAKALESPWSDMKQLAITKANTVSYDNTLADAWAKSERLNEVVNAVGLAYLTDTPNKTAYLTKMYATLTAGWANLKPGLNADSWTFTVPPGYAFFSSVVAYDLMYNDFAATERTAIESQLQIIADWFYNTPGSSDSWRENRTAAYGIWAVFKGDSVRITAARDMYYGRFRVGGENFDREINDSGVFSYGPGYAWARLNSNEYTKNLFMDILEHTGNTTASQHFYTDPVFQHFFEWLYGSAVSFHDANGRAHKFTFGDTSSEFWPDVVEQPAIFRANRFSAKAAGLASWVLNGHYTPLGSLLHYLYYTPPATPQLPATTIYYDMAVLRDTVNLGPDSRMSGALWNTTFDAYPTHNRKDVNAIHLSTYGEDLIKNAGYAGWGNGCAGNDWNYVSNNAAANNTVVIDNNNLTTTDIRSGGGITNGVTSAWFDAATGNSGAFLPNGTHARTLMLVHSTPAIGGYFVTLDEVAATSLSAPTAQAFFHPVATTYTTVTANQEYRFAVSYLTTNPVYLTLIEGIAPTTNEFLNGGLCAQATGWTSINGKYIKETYPLTQGKGTFFNVLYPHTVITAKPVASRLSGTNYQGLSLDFGNSTKDYLLQSTSATTPSTFGGVTNTGTFAEYRDQAGVVDWYYLKNGTQFLSNGNTGITASQPVTVTGQSTQGSLVTTASTAVTFYHPQISTIMIDGNAATVTASGTGWKRATIPAGTHIFQLGPQVTPTPTSIHGDYNVDGVVDYRDWFAFLPNFGQNRSEYKFIGTGLVNIFDVNKLIGLLFK